MRLSPGSTAVRRSTVSAPSLVASARSTRADEIAAKARLLDGKGKRPFTELGGLAEQLVGEHVEDGGRRRLLLGARRSEQRIEIDKAGGKLALGRDALAEIERELALEDLRVAVGVDGEIEIGELGAIGGGLIGPFSSKSEALSREAASPG